MATVTLSFHPVEEALREDLSERPETQDSSVLENTLFLMPVQLTIDGVQLFDYENLRLGYFELPLLGFCASLNRAVDKIRPGVTVEGFLAEHGWLYFTDEGARVRVKCGGNDRVAYATRSELVAAARKLRDEVRDWLVKNVPALQTHQNWTEWFPGATAYSQ